MIRIWAYMQSRVGRDSGATMVEYALILMTIVVVVVVSAGLLGAASEGKYTHVETCFDNPGGCGP